jgi:outer membrane protein OmpA-like peptidoglycan-associated protein
MTPIRPVRDCSVPIWLAGLATLALAAIAYLLTVNGIRATAEREANAALKAAGQDWAQFRVADRLGVIDGAPPDAQAAAAARVAVSQALAGKIGFPGVVAAITGAAGAEQLDLRGATPPPAAAPAEPAAPIDVPPSAPEPAPTAPLAPPAPTPAPAKPPVAAGAPLTGAKACEGAVLHVRAKRGINFASNSAALGPQARAVIAEIAAATARCQGVRIEIGGHTDARGAAFANQKLSEARAGAVREALIAGGVRAETLAARGYGETRPLNRGVSARDHARNRRITFTIVDAP